MLLALLVPPFQAPDEQQHFYRSYQLSKGEVWPRINDHRAGSELPVSIPELVERFLGTTTLHTDRKLSRQPIVETFAELRRPLRPERSEFVEFGTVSYAPFQYLPQAGAIAIGRTIGAGPLVLFYLARVANALTALTLTYWALRMLPLGTRFALVVALLPMTQFLLGSCSPDATTIAGAMLYAAITVRAIIDGAWSGRRTVVALCSGILMCTIKVVLFPLLATGVAMVLTGPRRPVHLRTAMVSQIVVGLAVLGITCFWFWSIGGLGGTPSEGVHPAKQLAYVTNAPLHFLVIIVRSLYAHGDVL
ncbi:MAG TPA: DUF2142 domain-containing protein, partial [Burkholderiales bacterium]|nr:DUF2142 domain-containing protein [Burkholderiales bacterium]